MRIAGIILSVVLSISGAIVALTIAIQIDTQQQISWAAKFAKAIIQDFFITPFFTLLINYLTLTCFVRNSGKNPRFRNVMKTLTEEEMIRLSMRFTRSSRLSRQNMREVKTNSNSCIYLVLLTDKDRSQTISLRRSTRTSNQAPSSLPRAAKLDGDTGLTRYNHSGNLELHKPRNSELLVPSQETSITRLHTKLRTNSNHTHENSLHDDKMNTSEMNLIQERSAHHQRHQQAIIIGAGVRPSMRIISQVSNGSRGELFSHRQASRESTSLKRVSRHDH